jgi:hypothetical protein
MAAARILRLAVALALLAAAIGGGRAAADDEEVTLRAPAGPYRGRVVDEKTGQPVPDALVVILWQRFDDEIQGLRRLVAARETFTDSNGEFVHDVAALEGKLPPRTLTPRLLVFRPGFTSVPSRPQVSPPGVSASRFAGPGDVATVTPVSEYEDRAEAFNTFIAMLSNAQLFPPTGLPDTEELIRFEQRSLGARPPTSATPRGGR